MKVLPKILSILKGKANDLGESYVDKHAIDLLKQQVREAETAQQTAKNSLVELMANKSAEEQKINAINEEIKKYTEAAKKALAAGNQELAREAAQKVAILTNKVNAHKTTASNYETSVEHLKMQVKESQQAIDHINEQLAIVETTDKVQKAESKISQSMASGKFSASSAQETLDRIQAKQQLYDNKVKAEQALKQESEGADLDAQLQQSGFLDKEAGTVSAEDILAQLQQDK